MQVNAISVNTPSFRASELETDFANMTDEQIKYAAWKKASVDVNDRRHKIIDNILYLSLPVVGGVSTLAQKMEYMPFKKGSIKIPVEKLRSAKLARAGIVTGAWTLALGAIGALWGLKGVAEKHIDSVNRFNKENPVISTVGALALSFGAVILSNRFSGKLIEKFLLKDTTEAAKKLLKTTKLDNALNTNKILNSAEEFIKKMPPALKDIGKNIVDFLPWIAVGTQIAHSYGHQSAKLNQVDKVYKDLKTTQEIIRQDIADEKINEKLSQRA